MALSLEKDILLAGESKDPSERRFLTPTSRHDFINQLLYNNWLIKEGLQKAKSKALGLAVSSM